MVQQNINADLQEQNKPRAVPGKKPIRRLYLNGFRNRKSVWAWSLILAIACTFISYPGIWYSDSYVRVTTAEAVANAIQNVDYAALIAEVTKNGKPGAKPQVASYAMGGISARGEYDDLLEKA